MILAAMLKLNITHNRAHMQRISTSIGIMCILGLHNPIQGNAEPMWISESLPFGNDNAETQVELVPVSQWANTPENSCMLAAESQACKAATAPATQAATPEESSANVDLPEVPQHEAITRREQFQCKKSVKAEKAKAKGASKGNKSTKGKGKGKGSGKGKAKKSQEASPKMSKSKLSKSKRRAKAKRVAKALARSKSEASISSEEGNPVPPKKACLSGAVEEEPSPDQQPADHDITDAASSASTDSKTTSSGRSSKKGKTSKQKRSKKVKDTSRNATANKAACKSKQKKSNDAKIAYTPVAHPAAKIKAKKLLGACYHLTHGCLSDHCDVTMPKHDNFQFSVYWTRRSVGVKILSTLLPEDQRNMKQAANKKGKGGKNGGETKTRKTALKWTQIAYFSGGPCTHVNIMLAETWVHSLNLLAAQQNVMIFVF